MNDAFGLSHAGSALPFPADTQIMFADHKGEHRKGIEKRQRKLAAKTAFITRFLHEGERVRLITTACSPFSTLEQVTTGWAIVYLKRALLVFTNERMLHVLTDSSFKYRQSLAEISYSSCSSLQQRFSALKVQYRDGKKERFLYVGRGERRRLKEFFRSMSFEGSQGENPERVPLCPKCTRPLQKDTDTCASCRLEFKSREEGRRIALIYPGGGYFYTGHRLLGIADALTEFLLMVLLILAIIGAANGEPQGWVSVTVIAAFLAIEKAISVYHTDHFIKEFIPKEKLTEPAAA